MMFIVPDLEDLTIVVTRPENQSHKLCGLIEASGGKAIRFPVINIVEPDNSEFEKTIEQLASFDMAIFISANAVNYGCKNIDDFPANTKIAAVGLASAEALRTRGLSVDIFPAKVYNSEALLQLDALQSVHGKKIAIFRGKDGRELLADTLKQRGAEVSYIECYRRAKPQQSPEGLYHLWKNAELDIIVVTSNEGLNNLIEMVGETGRSDLLKTPLLLVSHRTQSLALELGFTGSLNLASKASDEAIRDALILWSQRKRGNTHLD